MARARARTHIGTLVWVAVLKVAAGAPAEQLLEHMIELSLYAEEKLKTGV